jgi:hypothetical protein
MRRPRQSVSILVLALGLATAGCAGFTVPGTGGGHAVSPPDVGTAPGNGGQGGAGGGTGIGGGLDPGNGVRPSLETPVPGQLQPVAANVWLMTPTVDGRHVTVLLEWWSGPPPCSVLDSVQVARDGQTITMTPKDGADPSTNGQVACPAIAMLRGTIVDLGLLEPGAYTLKASGDLAPTEITVH